jgi:hypothetical protein
MKVTQDLKDAIADYRSKINSDAGVVAFEKVVLLVEKTTKSEYKRTLALNIIGSMGIYNGAIFYNLSAI